MRLTCLELSDLYPSLRASISSRFAELTRLRSLTLQRLPCWRVEPPWSSSTAAPELPVPEPDAALLHLVSTLSSLTHLRVDESVLRPGMEDDVGAAALREHGALSCVVEPDSRFWNTAKLHEYTRD